MGAAEKAMFLKYLYNPAVKFYYEFGSGGSTYKAIGAPNIEQIISIESDTSYYLSTLTMLTDPKCERIFVDVNSFNNWGYPSTDTPQSKYELYFKHIKSLSIEPDLILIDGRWRVACALHAWEKSGDHTVIIVDDFQRAEYKHILNHYNIIEATGNSVALRVDKSRPPRDHAIYEKDPR